MDKTSHIRSDMNAHRVSDPEAALTGGAKALGLDLDPAQCTRLLDFAQGVLDASRVVNLTGARDLLTVIDEHVLDSLALLPLMREKESARAGRDSLLIDVGSGGGFPALPLVVVRGRLHAVCIESVGKKARALADLAAAVAPDRVTVVNDRAERVAHDPQWRETADWATARGVARLPTACELALPFVRLGGLFLAQKGENPAAEIDEARAAISQLGGHLGRTISYEPRRGGVRRTVVLVEKISPTPAAFPRRPGLPAKRPLRGGRS